MEICRVLIISDYPLFAEGILQLIERQPALAAVGVTSPGEPARTAIRAERPDVVVVDLDVHTPTVPALLYDYPDIKFVGLSLGNNDIHIYYHHVKKITGVEALVEAIREPLVCQPPEQLPLRILAVVQGRYGRRIADNVKSYAPAHWQVRQWPAPAALPPVIDDPRDFLPPELPASDLILSLGESPAVAVLLPDVTAMTGARRVIAPVDNPAWLPAGLANQLREWLARRGVAAVFPKPFCSLTENTYNVSEHRLKYQDRSIAEFACQFGRPALRLHWTRGVIQAVDVLRDSACGCARHVAGKLVGANVGQAERLAGKLLRHFPCLASMVIDPDYDEALMHTSGYILQEVIRADIDSHTQDFNCRMPATAEPGGSPLDAMAPGSSTEEDHRW